MHFFIVMYNAISHFIVHIVEHQINLISFCQKMNTISYKNIMLDKNHNTALIELSEFHDFLNQSGLHLHNSTKQSLLMQLEPGLDYELSVRISLRIIFGHSLVIHKN